MNDDKSWERTYRTDSKGNFGRLDIDAVTLKPSTQVLTDSDLEEHGLIKPFDPDTADQPS